MLIHKKWVCIFFIVLGLVMALGNAYLLLKGYGLWQGFMLLLGIGWIWVGASNLRRLQKADLR
jgi:hypothetical protein